MIVGSHHFTVLRIKHLYLIRNYPNRTTSLYKRKGSAEDALIDSATRFAKLRPMRVEIFLRNQTPTRFLKPRRCLVA